MQSYSLPELPMTLLTKPRTSRATTPTKTPNEDPITLAVIGCGQRGKSYAVYAQMCPEKAKIVAIAEPRVQARDRFADTYGVDKTLVFDTWQELHVASAETLKTVGTRLADAVIVAVQDHMHKEVVLAFAAQGYHILCEKPLATSIEDCIEMEGAIKKAGIIFGCGHVMRYSPYMKDLTEIVRSQSLGKLVNVVHIEPVGYFHFVHSYVRGNWAKEKDSSFSLMTKSCHDIDILCHWLSPAKPKRVSSFGSLQHFKKSEKPTAAGNATRCLGCPIEKDCAYSAKRIYLDPVSRGNVRWPASTIVAGIPDIENITDALHNTPYGVCAYESDNDVCDHQVVNLEFTNGVTASFTMVAYTSLICDRQTRFHFTHGEIIASMGPVPTITVNDFKPSATSTLRSPAAKTLYPKDEGGGHGGGDLGLMRTFVEAVKTGNQAILGTNVSEVVRSHLTVFAAEKSRKEGLVVDCEVFYEQAMSKMRKE